MWYFIIRASIYCSNCRNDQILMLIKNLNYISMSKKIHSFLVTILTSSGSQWIQSQSLEQWKWARVAHSSLQGAIHTRAHIGQFNIVNPPVFGRWEKGQKPEKTLTDTGTSWNSLQTVIWARDQARDHGDVSNVTWCTQMPPWLTYWW